MVTDGWLRALRKTGGSWPNVYVAGDAACFPHRLSPDGPTAIPHWSTAGETARTIGAAIAAATQAGPVDSVPRLFALPSFWTDQYDLHILSYGLPGSADSWHLMAGTTNDQCVVGHFRNRRLVGVVGVGMRSAVLSLRDQIGSDIWTASLRARDTHRHGQERFQGRRCIRTFAVLLPIDDRLPIKLPIRPGRDER